MFRLGNLLCWVAVGWIVTVVVAETQGGFYTRGHGDIGLAYTNGNLELHYHLGPTAIVDGVPVGNAPDGREFAPNEQVTSVPNPSIARPVGAQWDFLGNSAGQQLWILPQTEDTNKPFLGVGTEELVPAEWATPLTFALTNMTGPVGGHFSLFTTDSFGVPTVAMATSNGINASDSFTMAAGGHAHFNYAFTLPGIYDLTWRASGTRMNAAEGFKQDIGTFRFAVATVPEPSSLALLGAGLLAVASRASRLRKPVQPRLR